VEHRERYSMQIACPQCGKIGRVVWAETQTPADSGNLDQAPKMLSPGFHPGPRHRQGREPDGVLRSVQRAGWSLRGGRTFTAMQIK
jgi:hypothetical protein